MAIAIQYIQQNTHCCDWQNNHLTKYPNTLVRAPSSVSSLTYLWSLTFTEEALPLIEAAIEEMTSKTCVIFEELEEEECAGVKNYVHITADDPVGG